MRATVRFLSAAVLAAMSPAGPAPTMITSYFFFIIPPGKKNPF
jgi:hypothetical protein